MPSPEAQQHAADLEAELRCKLLGEVRFDAGSRALYASHLSTYRQPPIGVVVPANAGDVELTASACRARGVPMLGRGAGTSLAGQCCNVAVVIDFSKYMNRILSVDPHERRADVQPGVIVDQLTEQTATTRPEQSQREEHSRLSRQQAAGWALGFTALTAAGVRYARR